MNSDTVVVRTARTGAPYASCAGLHLNSPYDPVREAARFLDGSKAPPASVFIILGDTLPHLRRELLERFPRSEVVSIYLHPDFPSVLNEASLAPSPRDFWSPSSPQGLREYLENRLAPADLDGVSLLQWPPAQRAFPELAGEAARVVEQLVREHTGNRVTSAAFGRAWCHNLFANFLSIDQWHLLEPHHNPVLIAASGPSLARALPAMRRLRNRFALVALPSSLEALAAAELSPDLLVTVDPGYWAQLHLRALELFDPMPVALPLVASRGLWRRSSLPVVLSTGSFVERELFRRAGLAPFEVLATATVGATALELACQWTDGAVVVAGLDLSYDGLDEHVRPHSFDSYFQATASRTSPQLAVLADRLLKLGLDRRNGSPAMTPALKAYAGWFRGRHTDGRVYRLFPSRVAIEGFSPSNDLAGILDRPRPDSHRPSARPSPTPELRERRKSISLLLDSWSAALHAAARHPSAEDPLLEELLGSLAPRTYLRYRQDKRTGRDRAEATRAELIEQAQEEVGALRRRFTR